MYNNRYYYKIMYLHITNNTCLLLTGYMSGHALVIMQINSVAYLNTKVTVTDKQDKSKFIILN